jgi:SH3-like domain-containing protein
VTIPLRAALPALLLLLAPPARGQSSLGQPGTLAPPRAAGTIARVAPPAPPVAPPAHPVPKPPTRPQAAAPAKPETKAPPKPPAPTPAPAIGPRPGSSNAPRPADAAKGARPKAAAAAAGAAAGAAAVVVAKPPEPAPPPKPTIGSATGLPLPRYAALGSNQVNLRIGPDLRYKIEWTYQRKDLPVQIVEEHQIWRRIRDPDGTEGWVQRPLLTSRRSFLVAGEERALRRRPEDNAEPVARLKPGVIGSLRKCDADSAWCEARVGDYRGWIRRGEIWGVTAGEAVN